MTAMEAMAWSPLYALGQLLAMAAQGQTMPVPWTVDASTGAALALWMAVPVALLLDRLWGEPPVWIHPVVAMGKALGRAGAWLAPVQGKDKDYASFCKGVLVWTGLAAIVFVFYALLQHAMQALPCWGQGLALGVLLKPLLAWRLLWQEVAAVEQALQMSLAAGRERLSWLVSRDTTALDAGVVRESAIETLAENLNDSVVAPLFWFVVAGLPGAALYRFANTADAMWGYPGWRGQGAQRRYWQWAGKWAARVDDVLNWLPARGTAYVLALSSRGVQLATLRRQAGVTPSPNGGWPMGAMALALQVRLGKPGVYVLNPAGKVPQREHVAQSIDLASKVVKVLVLSSVSAIVLIAWVGICGSR